MITPDRDWRFFTRCFFGHWPGGHEVPYQLRFVIHPLAGIPAVPPNGRGCPSYRLLNDSIRPDCQFVPSASRIKCSFSLCNDREIPIGKDFVPTTIKMNPFNWWCDLQKISFIVLRSRNDGLGSGVGWVCQSPT